MSFVIFFVCVVLNNLVFCCLGSCDIILFKVVMNFILSNWLVLFNMSNLYFFSFSFLFRCITFYKRFGVVMSISGDVVVNVVIFFVIFVFFMSNIVKFFLFLFVLFCFFFSVCTNGVAISWICFVSFRVGFMIIVLIWYCFSLCFVCVRILIIGSMNVSVFFDFVYVLMEMFLCE